MKHMEACLSAREDRESSFHQCGAHVRLVQACGMRSKNLITPFSPSRRCCEARGSLFKCHRRSRKQF